MTIVNLENPQHETRFQNVWRTLAGLLDLSEEDQARTRITTIGAPGRDNPNDSMQYSIVLPRPVSSDVTEIAPVQPGCKPIPPDTTEFILRFIDQRGTKRSFRTAVEHEVAMLTLLSDALSHLQPASVPRVFAWRSAADGPGWFLREYMQGEKLGNCLRDREFSRAHTGKVREQLAAIIKGLQECKLPAGITGLGSVTFDGRGLIVSAPHAYDGVGPWDNFESLLVHGFTEFLRKSFSDVDFEGWRERGVRTRIRNFLNEGLPARFASLTSKQERSIVHGRLRDEHFLCDPATGRITGMIGNGAAHISHPLVEFFESFASFRYLAPNMMADENEYKTNRIIYRYYSPINGYGGVPESERAMKTWERELTNLQAKQPRTIQGADKVAEVYTVLSELKIHEDETSREWSIKLHEKDLKTKLKHLGFT